MTKKDVGIGRWDATCDEAFGRLKGLLISAPIFVAPDWGKPFRCHVDASQRAVGGTLTQLNGNRADHVVAYFSKKLSETEQNYTASERELLGLVYFLKRFRCYLEGSTFDVFTDNQVLKNFFSKPSLNCRKARWLDLFAQSGIGKINLRPGRVHVLGDALSRAPHVMDETTLNHLTVGDVERAFPFAQEYEDDQLFGPIVRGLKGELPTDEVQKDRVFRLLPSFEYSDGRLLYDRKVCVPRR